jgi:ATP-dependent helicase YprA (DUF1998 family)
MVRRTEVTVPEREVRYRAEVGLGATAARENPFPPRAPALPGLLDLPEEVNSRSTHIATFADLGTSRSVVDALRARNITEPFPVQEMVISDALDGHDLLVQSPTGSGKTLADRR